MTQYPKIKHKLYLIKELYEEIKEIQSICMHEGLVGKYGANTGNYCSQDNSYWVDFTCPECGKKWAETQEEVGYQTSKEGFKFTRVRTVYA